MADRDVEIGAADADPVVGGLDEEVGEDGEGRLARDGGRDGSESFLELLACDGEAHSVPDRVDRGRWANALMWHAIY
ncbi:MAG: hypothetical protein U5K74_10810 [Gemmatimonadaceae bacterium]|nr:hypothetical protein [Gemmatimonadaceae bacterium]